MRCRSCAEQAHRALAIDPLLPEGHATLGTVAAWFDYDWPAAERHFGRAMAHGAIPPMVHRNYAMYCLLPTGRAQEAVDRYTLGLNEDPLNLMARAERAVCLRAAARLHARETTRYDRFSISTRHSSSPTSCWASTWPPMVRQTRRAAWLNVATPSRRGSSPWSDCWRRC